MEKQEQSKTVEEENHSSPTVQVASHFYSYSFALNPDWSRLYSTQPEIQAYFRDVTARFDVLPHIRFHNAVERADWDDATATWLVSGRDLRTGEQWTRRCKILVSAVGALSVPKTCDVPGADAFQGSLFHSAEWDHSFDWKGKDVVVLGKPLDRLMTAESRQETAALQRSSCPSCLADRTRCAP